MTVCGRGCTAHRQSGGLTPCLEEESRYPRTRFRIAFCAGRKEQRQEHDGLGEMLSFFS